MTKYQAIVIIFLVNTIGNIVFALISNDFDKAVIWELGLIGGLSSMFLFELFGWIKR